MGDMEKAVAACRRAQADGVEISDACARVIASMFHNGGDSLTASLASTGEICHGTSVGGLCRELFSDATYSSLPPDERLLYDMMGKYLFARLYRGERTVEGWPHLWL